MTTEQVSADQASNTHWDTVLLVGEWILVILALITLLGLLARYWKRLAIALRFRLRRAVSWHLVHPYSLLAPELICVHQVNRRPLVNAAVFINDAWPSTSAVGWSEISESSPEIERGLMAGYEQTNSLMQKMRDDVILYWRTVFSIWEILTYEISREALGRGYVTDEWVGGVQDWFTCLETLQRKINGNQFELPLSDVPIVALRERLRALSSEGKLFSEVSPGDLVLIFYEGGFRTGPYLLTKEVRQVGSLPTFRTEHKPAMPRMIPIFEAGLKDCNGLRRTIQVSGTRWSVIPNLTPQDPVIGKFPAEWAKPEHAEKLLVFDEPDEDASLAAEMEFAEHTNKMTLYFDDEEPGD